MSTASRGTSIARAASRGAARGSWRKGSRKPAESVQAESSETSSQQAKTPRRLNPTHFLSLPLGHHTGLCNKVQVFTDALLNLDPGIAGLEQSVIIEPARLHITLGVMHLKTSTEPSTSAPKAEEVPNQPTVSEALALLEKLRDSIVEELKVVDDGSLRVPLDAMGVLQTEKRDFAHVLWIGPKHSKTQTPFDKVAKMVNSAFRKEGFITEKRPLKLHCTVINTSKRKKSRQRIPFSRVAIYASDPYKALLIPEETIAESSEIEVSKNPSDTRTVDFGSWKVDEIQLCEMGSRDPKTGAYVSIGGIRI